MLSIAADGYIPALNQNGGDKFIARFGMTEAARLGMTGKEFFATCESAMGKYDLYTKMADDLGKECPSFLAPCYNIIVVAEIKRRWLVMFEFSKRLMNLPRQRLTPCIFIR